MKDFYDSLDKKIQDCLSRDQFDAFPNFVQDRLTQTTFSVNQIEYIKKIPWQNSIVPDIDFSKARTTLEDSHYGMKEVKERIIRYIACQKHLGSSYGAVLLLVGPPGVGKTSIAKSIADTMGRKFEKISLAGMSDAFDLKGLNRNYKNAKPGLIIESLIRSENLCPLILLDELDKAGRSSQHGDPAYVLLDILDNDRTKFTDSLIDIPVDLSNVIFVLTANDTSIISPILLDRLEIVKLKGYSLKEKIKIAENYLIPILFKKFKIKPENLTIGEEIIKHLIEKYTNEPGIRSLERRLTQICEAIISYIYTEESYDINLGISEVCKILTFSNSTENKIPGSIKKAKVKQQRSSTSERIYNVHDDDLV